MDKIKYRVAGEDIYFDGDKKDLSKCVRTSFAFVGEDEELVVQEAGDTVPMVIKLGMQEDSDTFEMTIRGVFDASNIILFIGEYYRQIPDVEYLDGLIPFLRPAINERYGYYNTDIAIWNGVQIGSIGDIWPPVKLVGILHPDDSITWISKRLNNFVI